MSVLPPHTAPGRPSAAAPLLRLPVRWAPARRVELIDPIEDGRWAAFVARAPRASVHHHRAWLDLLHTVFGCPVVACCLVDATGAIQAGVPLALVSDGRRGQRLACLPLAARCGALPEPDEDPVLADELVAALDELRRELGVPMQLRGPSAAHPAVRLAVTYRAHSLPLGPELEPPAETSDELVVERRTDALALAELYRLHAAACRRRGEPAPPRRFVLGFAHLFDRGLGFVLLARHRARTVTGGVFTSFNRTLAYQYGGPAPDGDGDPVLRAAVRWGCRAGMRTLELGRIELDDERRRGLMLSLGAQEALLDYRELRDDEPRQRRARLAWTAPLIRRTPLVVSRAVGEAVYPGVA